MVHDSFQIFLVTNLANKMTVVFQWVNFRLHQIIQDMSPSRTLTAARLRQRGRIKPRKQEGNDTKPREIPQLRTTTDNARSLIP